MKKNMLCLIAMLAVLALVMTGCGGKAGEETLGFSRWEMSALAWSSNNGATMTLEAVPQAYAKGQTAAFVVRLEGEEIERAECQWNGEAFTAQLDLNAADGLCYYLIQTTSAGETAELELNTPANPVNEAQINLAHALEAYCHMAVTDFTQEGSILTVAAGDVEIVLPRITRDGKAAQCTKAELVLSYDGQEVGRQALALTEDLSSMTVTGVQFTIPAMEDDEQLTLTLEAALADGQVLTAPACTWFFTDGRLVPSVG